LRWGGWCLALACVCLKVIVVLDPFPYWGTDPTRIVLPESSLTPAGSVFLDACVLFSAGLALIGDWLIGARIGRITSALWALGAIGAGLQAFRLHSATLDDARIGLSWTAALGAGLAAVHLCRDPALRRITLACTVGVAGALIAKGVLQYFVEHPATVVSYRANRSAFLEAQGWLPDSSQARSFERRLDQAEASGWFGMANVYASFMAAGLIAMLGWAVLAWRRMRERVLNAGWPGLLSLGAVLCAAGVWMAGSKAGVTVCILGMILLGAGALPHHLVPEQARARLSRAGGILAVLIIEAAIVAVVARGLVGERSTERSLLFRWYYFKGAAAIFFHHPLAGVGPANFKDAYLLDKPPMSPEDVASPHSVLLDYAATLGVFGLAWAGLWLTWVANLGINYAKRWVLQGGGQPASAPLRPEVWAVAAVVCTPTLAAAWIERTLPSPEGAIARLAGAAAWLGFALAALLFMRTASRSRWIAAAAAIAIAAHAQIEMTGTWTGAAGLFMVLIACAASGDADRPTQRRPDGAVGPVAMAAAGLAAAVLIAIPVADWERQLARAADGPLPHRR
jgi:hypothetical protein